MIDAYEKLANSVILQAVKDYRAARKTLFLAARFNTETKHAQRRRDVGFLLQPIHRPSGRERQTVYDGRNDAPKTVHPEEYNIVNKSNSFLEMHWTVITRKPRCSDTLKCRMIDHWNLARWCMALPACLELKYL